MAMASGLLAGCSRELAPPGSRFLVSAQSAQFYKYGPAQSFGADFVLPKGQRVIMLDRSFGFSRVMTEDGISGWIASEELTAAPPEPRRAAAKGGRRGIAGGGSPRLFVLGDANLTLAVEPAFDWNGPGESGVSSLTLSFAMSCTAKCVLSPAKLGSKLVTFSSSPARNRGRAN